ITGGASRSFQNAESAQADPLAAALFAVGNVTSVFYMDRFVTVNKEDEVSWEEMLKKLAEPIRSAPTTSEPPAQAQAPVYTPSENTPLDRTNQVLDHKVRPRLAGDGSRLEIIGLEDKKLLIRYQGACRRCPSTIGATIMAMEYMLNEHVHPEIKVSCV